METIYFTTSNFIRHEGNMVDLTEYRRKLSLAQGTAPDKAQENIRSVPKRTARRHNHPGLMLDYAASVALIVTALSFAVKIL